MFRSCTAGLVVGVKKRALHLWSRPSILQLSQATLMAEAALPWALLLLLLASHVGGSVLVP